MAAGTLEAENLPESRRQRLPGYPLPELRLARLAVDVKEQSRGVGTALLRHAFHLAIEMSERLGCVGIVVDAKPDAVDFYARLRLSPIELVGAQCPATDIVVGAARQFEVAGLKRAH